MSASQRTTPFVAKARPAPAAHTSTPGASSTCTRLSGYLWTSRDQDGMRRRARRRAVAAATSRPPGARDHQARIHVSDEVWRKVRDVVGNNSMASYLGRLVERAVERDRVRRVREGSVDHLELLDVLEPTRELLSEVAVIVARLERTLDERRS